MSLEAKVKHCESKQQSLDHAVRELIKVVSATHEVVALTLKEQLEVRKELREFKTETQAGFSRIDQRFDQLELLIRQKLPLE